MTTINNNYIPVSGQCPALQRHHNGACLCCRNKKRACNKKRPVCQQCRHVGEKCVYADEATTEISSDLAAVQWALNELEFEIIRMKRPLAEYARGASYYRYAQDRNGSEVVLREKETNIQTEN